MPQARRAEHLGAERDESMKELQEARQHAMDIGDHKVQVGGHEADDVHLQAVTAGRNSEGIEDQLCDGGIGAEEQVSAQGAAGEEIGGAWDNRAGLAHGMRGLPRAVPEDEA